MQLDKLIEYLDKARAIVGGKKQEEEPKRVWTVDMEHYPSWIIKNGVLDYGVIDYSSNNYEAKVREIADQLEAGEIAINKLRELRKEVQSIVNRIDNLIGASDDRE